MIAVGILVVLLIISVAGIGILSTQLEEYSTLQDQFRTLAQQNFELQDQALRLRVQIANPTLVMWNSCGEPCYMNPGEWRAGGVPDTFDYNITFTSTVPVSVYILTFDQYVQFANCSGQIACATGQYYQYGPTTSLQGIVFKLAEGCAGYVSVYRSSASGIIYPNVKLTYNPAPGPTGVCATSP